MKRTITISGQDDYTSVQITARINTGRALVRGEVKRTVDGLADSLMHAVTQVKYTNIPLSRVKVK